MVAINALTVLALATASLAVPVAQPLEVGEALVARDAAPARPWGGYRANYSWRWGYGRPQGQGQSQPEAQPQAPAEDDSSDDSSDDSQSAPAQPAPQTPAPQSPPSGGQQSGSGSGSDSSASTPPASGGSSGGYMGIVSTWRSNMGLPALTEDNKLQSNAQDASASSGGQLKHKLNPGSMAQVMAPGNDGNFESVFVGGWLCELPNLPGLGASVCNSATKGWNHAGQTGHAEILSSTKYTKIGCGLADGIWSCDLA